MLSRISDLYDLEEGLEEELDKSLFTDSERDDVLICELVKWLYYFINHYSSSSSSSRIVKGLFTILSSQYGEEVLKYIAENKAFTILILEKELKLSKQTLGAIIRNLVRLDQIQEVDFINDPLNERGPRTRVYLLKGASPDYAAKAQLKHMDLKYGSKKAQSKYEGIIAEVSQKIGKFTDRQSVIKMLKDLDVPPRDRADLASAILAKKR